MNSAKTDALLWSLILVMAVCPSCDSGTSGNVGISSHEIRIGTIQDLSGPLAYLGAELPHGARLYFGHINDSGGVFGRRLKLVVEDHGYDPVRAVTAAKRLLARDGVFCLFNVMGSAPNLALLPMVEEAGVPLIAPAAQTSSLISPPRKYVFQADTPYEIQSRLILRYVMHEIRPTPATVGVVYQDDEFGHNVLRGVEEEARRWPDLRITAQGYERGAVDFGAQLFALRRAAAEVVILGAVHRETVAILRKAQEIGFQPWMFGLSPSADHRVIRDAGASCEGFVVSSYLASHDSDAQAARDYRALLAKYDPEHLPGRYDFYGFVSAIILVEALHRAGPNLDREKLLVALESFDAYSDGAHPPITFGPGDRAGATSVRLLQVRDGRFDAITDWLDLESYRP